MSTSTLQALQIRLDFKSHVKCGEFFLFFPPSHIPCIIPFNDVFVLQYSPEGCISPLLIGKLRFFFFGRDGSWSLFLPGHANNAWFLQF